MLLWLIISFILLIICLYFYKNELQVRTIKSSRLVKGRPIVGIVSDWDRKGVPYQSRFLSKCLSNRSNVFVLAYHAYVKDESDCGYRNLVFTKIIKSWKVINWIKKNHIKVVFFPDRLEDRTVLDWCKKNNVATVMIINYETIKKEEFNDLKANKVLICPVKCTQDLLKRSGFKNTRFIRWGIDSQVYRPKNIKIKTPIRFFHNAGHGGAEWRKNTLAVVQAFDAASRQKHDIFLVLKSQKPISEYPSQVRYIIACNRNIIVMDKDLSMRELKELYGSCHVSLLPSKWEGIGIPFLESLAMGLPVITVDAPPMNEWVQSGRNGFCAKTDRWEQRKDKQLLVKGAIVDINSYSKLILKLADPELIIKLRKNAIKSMKDSKKMFAKKIESLVKSLC